MLVKHRQERDVCAAFTADVLRGFVFGGSRSRRGGTYAVVTVTMLGSFVFHGGSFTCARSVLVDSSGVSEIVSDELEESCTRGQISA